MSSLTDRERFLAFLAGISLFLSLVEFLIPRPLPFLRIGLANLPVLLFIRRLAFRDLLLLGTIKILAQGFLHGTLLSYTMLFMIAGTAASFTIMKCAVLLFKDLFSFVGISVLGAIANSTAQLLMAIFLIFPATAWSLAPLILGSGVASGTLLGLFALKFSLSSKWYASVQLL